jgi:hypothetical protein
MGSYYVGTNFQQFVGSEIDPNIDFNWGSGGPAILGLFALLSISSSPSLTITLTWITYWAAISFFSYLSLHPLRPSSLSLQFLFG